MVTYEVFVGGFFSLLVLGAGAFYWLMSEIRSLRRENREDSRALREELRTEIRENSQRILEALYFHRHDSEGAAVFYPSTCGTCGANS